MSENENEIGNRVTVQVQVGKEIDAALGDVIRALLEKPALAVGDLTSDALGFLGSRMKQKFQASIALGLEDTREMLNTRGVRPSDISAPSEEGFQVVLNGMSLSGDEKIRKMWSGLLASALDPNCDQEVERPITSTIEALSPRDAQIIDFAAYVTAQERALQKAATENAGIGQKQNLTYGDVEKIEKARAALSEHLSIYFEQVTSYLSEHGLADIRGNEWADNLVRLGLIEPYNQAVFDEREFSFGGGLPVNTSNLKEAFQHIQRQVAQHESKMRNFGKIPYFYKVDEARRSVTLGFQFTRLGRKFCNACSIQH